MSKKYHDIATANKAIVSGSVPEYFMCTDLYKMLPQCGLESAPSDLIAWSLVSFIREKLSVGVKNIVNTAHTLG